MNIKQFSPISTFFIRDNIVIDGSDGNRFSNRLTHIKMYRVRGVITEITSQLLLVIAQTHHSIKDPNLTGFVCPIPDHIGLGSVDPLIGPFSRFNLAPSQLASKWI